MFQYRQVTVPVGLNKAFDSTGQAPGERPPPNEPIDPNSKKAPPPTGMVVFLCDQIKTTMGHCDLFQWLKKILTPLRLRPLLAVRDQITSCFKSTPLVLLVQRELNFNKTPPKNTMQKEESSSAKMPKTERWVDPHL
jgi:hypothetical protein